MRAIIHLDSVDSTQDEIVRRLKAGLHVDAILADSQSAGKGRLGKAWETIPGGSLAASIVWYEAADPPWPAGIALAAGIAAAEAFDTDLMWPNDLVIGSRKVGGILCEMVHVEGRRLPVIGLGLNLRSSPPELSHATSLANEGRVAPAARDAAEMFLSAIDGFPIPRSFSEIASRWHARDRTEGKPFTLPDGRASVALSVAEDGALRAAVGGEIVVVPSATAIYGSCS